MKFILVILSFLTVTNAFIPNLHTKSYVKSLKCESNDDDYFYFDPKNVSNFINPVQPLGIRVVITPNSENIFGEMNNNEPDENREKIINERRKQQEHMENLFRSRMMNSNNKKQSSENFNVERSSMVMSGSALSC